MNYKALATLMLLTSLSWGHDFWLKPAPQGAILRYGHGSEEEPYKSEKLKKASALDAQGKVLEVKTADDGGKVRLQSPAEAVQLGIELDNGYWSKNVGGWANRSRRETPGCLLSEWSLYYAKVLLKSQSCLGKPFGHPLEIVPLEVRNDHLRVRVLLHGKPVSALKIYSNHKRVAESDEHGEASWKREGETIVSVSMKEALQGNPDAERLNLHASLTVP